MEPGSRTPNLPKGWIMAYPHPIGSEMQVSVYCMLDPMPSTRDTTDWRSVRLCEMPSAAT